MMSATLNKAQRTRNVCSLDFNRTFVRFHRTLIVIVLWSGRACGYHQIFTFNKILAYFVPVLNSDILKQIITVIHLYCKIL